MIDAQIIRLSEDQILPVTPEVLETSQSLIDLRDKARYDGYAEGYREGQEKAAEEAARNLENFQAKARQIITVLEEALESSKNLLEAEQQNLEQYAARLSVEMAESVLDHEIATGQISVLDTIRHALSMLPATGEIIARVNPGDLEFIQSADIVLPLRLVSDQSVQPAGCILEMGSAMVDARLDMAIQRIKKELAMKADIK